MSERLSFLGMAVFFQGGLFLLALLLGDTTNHPPEPRVIFSLEGWLLGIAATGPMLLFLWIVYHSRISGFRELQEIVRKILGRQLSVCGWLDLVALSLMAGISEEFLFRGFLESWFSRWGVLPAVVLSNVLFGICHAVTPTYALLAALLGCYLSLTLRMTAEPNLLVPIIGHSLYDFVAFVVIRNDYLRNDVQDPPNHEKTACDTNPPDYLNAPTER